LFSFSSIKDYQANLLNGQTSCVEAVSFYLEQIKKNSHLNAFLEVYEKEAISRAIEIDAEIASVHALGKMHGVVVALKDVLCYKDHKASAASKILENHTAIYNATAVQKLLAEGANHNWQK
jgi:aspartyl-tRNA(Asn)/glutamyl-tRNA(Gln) amidotransferase subunit A